MKDKKIFQFNVYAFFIAFFFGIFYTYITAPKPRIIVKYPTPYNVDKIIYKNSDDLCYKYKSEITECTKQSIPQPIV